MKSNDISLMNILLVDNSVANTTLLRAVLKNEKFKNIDITTDKTSTLNHLESNKVDLILITTILSDYCGLQLSSDINSDLRYGDIPILMVTADKNVETLRKGFESGAVDYISKPINSVELIARVQAHLIRKQILDEKHKLSITDQLTSLYNRRYFDTIFDTLYAKSLLEEIPLIFFMIDIDNFKKYNDNYGHHKGDEVLKSISKAIKNTLIRKTDYLFRLGGEEFAILLLDAPNKYYTELSQSLHNSIEALGIEHNYNEDFGRLTVSMGVCEVDINENISKFDIYNAADRALYEAKDNGRNHSQFTFMT